MARLGSRTGFLLILLTLLDLGDPDRGWGEGGEPILCRETTTLARGLEATHPASELHCACSGKLEFFMNTDRIYGEAIGWTGRKFKGNEGAFAEYFEPPDDRPGAACQLLINVAEVGAGRDQTVEIMVWADDSGVPGEVLGTIPLSPLRNVRYWPLIDQRILEIFEIRQIGVEGGFWAGFRGDWSSDECSILVAVDTEDEDVGRPALRRTAMTYVPKGAAWSEGWHPVEDLIGEPAALGIGVLVGWCPVPVEERSWGQLKSRYREVSPAGLRKDH